MGSCSPKVGTTHGHATLPSSPRTPPEHQLWAESRCDLGAGRGPGPRCAQPHPPGPPNPQSRGGTRVDKQRCWAGCWERGPRQGRGPPSPEAASLGLPVPVHLPEGQPQSGPASHPAFCPGAPSAPSGRGAGMGCLACTQSQALGAFWLADPGLGSSHTLLWTHPGPARIFSPPSLCPMLSLPHRWPACFMTGAWTTSPAGAGGPPPRDHLCLRPGAAG